MFEISFWFGITAWKSNKTSKTCKEISAKASRKSEKNAYEYGKVLVGS